MKNNLLYCVALSLILVFWSLITPLFEFPDEQGHFAMVQFMAEQGRIPQGNEYDLSKEEKVTEDLLGTFRDKFGNNNYTYHPDYHPEYTTTLIGKYEPDIQLLNTSENRTTYVWTEAARYPALYYAYSAVWYRFVYAGDLITRIFVVRLGSIFLSTVMIIVAYYLGREVFKREAYARTLAIMVLFQPMLSFVGAGVNSDNLHNLLYMIFFYLLVRYLKYGWKGQNWLYLAMVIAADFYTKPQAYITIPIIILAMLVRGRVNGWKRVGYTKWFVIAVVVVLAILPQEGQKFISALNNGVAPYTTFPDTHTTNHPSFIEFAKFSVNKFYSQNIVWYWGIYKWLGIVLPRIWWWIANRIVAIAALGVLVGLFGRRYKKVGIPERSVILFLIGSVAIYILAIFGYDWVFAYAHGYSFGVQARYYFPVAGPSLILILYGITSLGWNDTVKGYFHKMLLIFFFCLQLGGIWRLVTSYYDVSSVQTFITQASQYKPLLAKGQWWYLWIGLYLGSILTLLGTVLVQIRHDSRLEDKAKQTAQK